MDIEQFMQGYKQAWEERDELQFCALFAADGEYHNTPFAVQRGHAELAAYWQRGKLQEDVRVRYEILATTPTGGIAHWHVTYQVASEELFRIWAQSTRHQPGRAQAGRSAPADGARRGAEDGVRGRSVPALRALVAQPAGTGMSAAEAGFTPGWRGGRGRSCASRRPRHEADRIGRSACNPSRSVRPPGPEPRSFPVHPRGGRP